MDDGSSGGASWFGDVFRKFETIRLEDGLKYVEDQLQSIGASVEQFCSEYLPEPEPFNPDSDGIAHTVDEGTAEGKPSPEAQTLDLNSDEQVKDVKHLHHETINKYSIATADDSTVTTSVLDDSGSVIGNLEEVVEKKDSQEDLSESIILVEVEELPPASAEARTPKSLKKKMAPLFFGLEPPKWRSKASTRSRLEMVEKPAAVSSSSEEFTSTDWEIL